MYVCFSPLSDGVRKHYEPPHSREACVRVCVGVCVCVCVLMVTSSFLFSFFNVLSLLTRAYVRMRVCFNAKVCE